MLIFLVYFNFESIAFLISSSGLSPCSKSIAFSESPTTINGVNNLPVGDFLANSLSLKTLIVLALTSSIKSFCLLSITFHSSSFPPNLINKSLKALSSFALPFGWKFTDNTLVK